MKAPTTKIRFSDAKTLLDYGFANYKFEKTTNQSTVIQEVTVNKGSEKTLNLVYEKDSRSINKKI